MPMGRDQHDNAARGSMRRGAGPSPAMPKWEKSPKQSAKCLQHRRTGPQRATWQQRSPFEMVGRPRSTNWRDSCTPPNKGLQLTAYSLRSAPAFGKQLTAAFGFLPPGRALFYVGSLLPCAPCSMLVHTPPPLAGQSSDGSQQLLLPHTASRTMRRWKWHAVKFRPADVARVLATPEQMEVVRPGRVVYQARVTWGHPQPPISCASLSILTASPQTL